MKKFTAILLVFSLMMLSANLYAKEKRGAKLVITKKDGLLIEGELITVKEDSLLLLDTAGKDVSVDTADIEVIRIKKKSKAGLGAGIGFLTISGGTVLACGTGLVYTEEGMEWAYGLLFGALLAVPALILGGLIGAMLGTDETIQLEGMSDSEIQEALVKLRKKARIRDYK